MEILPEVNIKSLVFGAAIAATFALLGSQYNEIFYACASFGFLYVGYEAKNLLWGAGLGAFSATPLACLALDGVFKEIPTGDKAILVIVVILLVGAFVGLVGAWVKKDREKAKEEYEKKQQIGKNKNKNKNKNKK